MTVHPIRPPRDYAEPFVFVPSRPDLYAVLANADAPRLAAPRGRYVFAYRRYRGAIAFALNAVVIAGCFLLIASGTL